MTNTLRSELLNTRPLRAASMFSTRKFNQWLELRWEMLDKWHQNNQQMTVEPCMAGEHFRKGVKYNLGNP